MTFQAGVSGNPGGSIIHGFYTRRERTCDACGARYVAPRLSSRYCSVRCRTSSGPWSFRAARPLGWHPKDEKES